MRLSLEEPNILRATAPNMPEFLSRPLRVVPPNQMHDRQSSPTHSNCGAFRAWQGATANAPMSGPAGCGEIGGGRTLVNRQRPVIGRNHALVGSADGWVGCREPASHGAVNARCRHNFSRLIIQWLTRDGLRW